MGDVAMVATATWWPGPSARPWAPPPDLRVAQGWGASAAGVAAFDKSALATPFNFTMVDEGTIVACLCDSERSSAIRCLCAVPGVVHGFRLSSYREKLLLLLAESCAVRTAGQPFDGLPDPTCCDTGSCPAASS
ncbi:unnamed protein product [Urochloa humidicola]